MSSKRPKKIYDYYILVYAPEHDRAVAEGYVAEHILVAEKALGRTLTQGEEVRHINGNTHDNRPENLEVTSPNADFRVVSLNDIVSDRKPIRTFIPCKFQKPCWKEIRSKIARENNIYLPYRCSFQEEGDIYKCSHFWNYLDNELRKG